MNQDGSIEVFHYWNSLRNGRPAPKQSEIDPAGIKSFLGNIFILDRGISGDAMFRLAGTQVASIYGHELKGLSFLSLWADADRNLVESLIEGVFSAGSLVSLTFDGATRSSRLNAFDMVVMPLDGGSGNPRVLGAVLPVEKPYWLGAYPIVAATVTSVRLVDSNRVPPRRAKIEVPALLPDELPSVESKARQRAGRRIRHLVVFDGGRTR